MTAYANAPKRKFIVSLRATELFRSPDAPLGSLTAGGAIKLLLQIEPPVKREAVVNLACRSAGVAIAARNRATRCK